MLKHSEIILVLQLGVLYLLTVKSYVHAGWGWGLLIGGGSQFVEKGTKRPEKE